MWFPFRDILLSCFRMRTAAFSRTRIREQRLKNLIRTAHQTVRAQPRFLRVNICCLGIQHRLHLMSNPTTTTHSSTPSEVSPSPASLLLPLPAAPPHLLISPWQIPFPPKPPTLHYSSPHPTQTSEPTTPRRCQSVLHAIESCSACLWVDHIRKCDFGGYATASGV
jgi:hypothetical protein